MLSFYAVPVSNRWGDFRRVALCLSFLICIPRTVMTRASQDGGEV